MSRKDEGVAAVSADKLDSAWFRGTIGFLCIAGSLIGFGGLYFVEVPVGNRDALMLALGIVFGWGSAVVQSEYGSTATGRKVADSAIRNIERQAVAAEVVATGKSDDPVHVEGPKL